MASLASTARTVDVEDDVLAAIDACYERGWTDGLPVVPPEMSRVEAMLAMEGRPPETVIATHPTTGLECSILAAAVNAVMAGCLPGVFPGRRRGAGGGQRARVQPSTVRPPAPAVRRHC